MKNQIKVWVVRDEEGILRPMRGLWVISSENISKAVVEEWQESLSKKKEYKTSNLVKATLTED